MTRCSTSKVNTGFSILSFVFILTFLFTVQACKVSEPKNEITPEDDITIGKTLDDAILAHVNTSAHLEYLSPNQFPGAYSYVNNIKNTINGSVNFVGLSSMMDASIANLTIRIIHHKSLSNCNAFVVPGGYIYLYKDFLEKIETEAQFVAVLSHLMACSKGRHAVHKLENRFALGFMLDLALGGTLSNVGIASILSELEDIPYDVSLVEDLDIETEHTVCELGYDVKSYSDLYNHPSSQNLKWYLLFPRTSNSSYANYLFNDVKNSSAACLNGETDGQPEYLSFKNTLN